jgi:hypothetical protein
MDLITLGQHLAQGIIILVVLSVLIPVLMDLA